LSTGSYPLDGMQGSETLVDGGLLEVTPAPATPQVTFSAPSGPSVLASASLPVPIGAGEHVVVLPEADEAGGLLSASRWQLVTKRAIDVIASVVLLILLLPLLLLIAAAVRLTSRGPALYVQERIGRGGRPFSMYKFRSMRVTAHERRGDVEHLNEARGPVFKIRRDPRVTATGLVIRRLSIDELPQLINVLRGQMSLVGPRPPLPEEFRAYDARQLERLRVLPGLTCIWQVSGRSDLAFDTWVEMDLEYIRSWSLRQDLKLLLLTLPAVVFGRGAY
jgi:lipopolysaccharide/colanic/teichoic acid biosynthesis glycosyltransferase